ncbi:PREDICTED: mitochondrial inner membrane protein OXA1-like [Ipomoea nil]|uniref:mitochondrial inner membrane protein OXA1-like n=1 Tax=Ipomoea nil TaxID=35883 RepID=UPI000901870C|nr:PREDICTED: mitochondrial inner membrane protein OXA1-like [Ipomoea nil]
MAYRRSISTRAELFYQQQRFAPSFSHLQRDDDRKNHPESCSENPKIFRYLQHSCSGNGVSGTRNSFVDRRFCAPMSLGGCLVRNMSTGVGEGVDKIEYMSDIADVLSDKAVEVVASQAPVVNEVAIAAADSFLPVAVLQHLIDYVHCYTGLNWWASIIAASFMIRLITLPLNIHQLKATSRLTLLRPKLDAIREDMQNRGMSPSAVSEGQQEMKKLFNEYKVTPFTALKGIFIQGPIFVCFFLAISNMAEKVPSFKEGGAFWFTDLTTPDSMYILPVLTALTFLITVEFNAQEGLEGNPAGPTIKKVSRIFALLTVPLTASFPKAIFMYWITSNLFSLTYGMVLKKPEMKKLLGIPIIPVAPPSPASQKPGFSFFEALNKYSAAQQQAQSASTNETSIPTNQRVPPSSVLSQRIRSLEKQVKEKKKGGKKR